MKLLICILLLSQLSFSAEDWPRFRGKNGDGISSETGISKDWRTDPPKVLWRKPLGEGYAGIIVQNGRLFTLASIDSFDYVIAFNSAAGELLWKYKINKRKSMALGAGPTSTPTLENNKLYLLGQTGMLLSIDATTGKKLWSIDIPSQVGNADPVFGYAPSPFLQNDQLLLASGDSSGLILSFNKKTGKLNWKAGTGSAAYATPIAFNFEGQRQIVFMAYERMLSVSPNGKVLWQFEMPRGEKAAMPLFVAPNQIYYSLSYDVGATLLQVYKKTNEWQVEEIWRNRHMRNHFHSAILLDGHIYGFDNTILKCMDSKTGEIKWAKHRLGGRGSLIYADNHFIVLNERGKLYLVEANPEKFVDKGSLQVLRGRTWTSPTLANGKLYLRNEKELVSFDISGDGS